MVQLRWAQCEEAHRFVVGCAWARRLPAMRQGKCLLWPGPVLDWSPRGGLCMRTTKTLHSDAPKQAEEAEVDEVYESLEVYRVSCPVCEQRIGLLADEDRLPEHALCPTPWDPFGLTVCQGSGTAASAADIGDSSDVLGEQGAAVLLTLPAGLDWRTQPFSHAGSSVSGVPAQGGRG